MFLNGPKFQMEVSKITGWRVMDAVKETASKDTHAIKDEFVVEKMTSVPMDKHFIKHRVSRDFMAK